jgi:signal transduction histidine kinase
LKRISTKQFAGMMALVLCMVAVSYLFQIVLFESWYVRSKSAQLSESALELSDMLAQGSSATTQYIENQRRSQNVSTLIFDVYGLPIYRSDNFRNEVWAQCLSLREQVSAGASISQFVDSDSFNLRFLCVGVPVSGGGALFLLKPVDDFTETIGILKNQALIQFLVMTLLAVLISAILARRLTRPIRQIEERAAKMAEGDLSTPFVPTTRDELGRLTQTLETTRLSLQRVDHLSKELIANVSHELRTPLAIIRGFAETVRDVTWKNDEKREKQLNAIVEESARLERVVNDILDYSQLQSGSIHYHYAPVDLSELCERLGERMRNHLERGGISLEKQIDGSAFVKGDETKLEQVLYNLIANAFNHSPAGSQISLRLMLGEGSARVEVQDQGEGIDPAEIKDIWKRYYRSGLRNREERIGTGLGLAVCKTILEAHGAQFGVHSQPGEGSLFYFVLPLLSVPLESPRG